ncbi:MAG: hypothetical protein ABL958_04380 [Bdellovibrionia bacterium]
MGKCVLGLLFLLVFMGGFSAEAGTKLGVVYANGWADDAAVITKHVERIKAAGFSRIVIPFWGCQPDTKSSEVGSCEVAPPSTFILQAKIAQSLGLEVSFLPIVGTPKGEWRGLFKPENVSRWFQTYFAWVKMVAVEAEKLKMKELVAATEFSVYLYSQTQNWKILLANLRPYFTGRLIITTNWDHPDFDFWSEADAFGISAYFPLSTGSTTMEALVKGAVKNREAMRAKAAKAGKPLHVTEFGFPGTVTAAAKPWYYPAPGEPVPAEDMPLQARCHEAFLKSWENETLPVNMNVWATHDPTNVSPISFEVIGKPSEAILKKYAQAMP